MRARRRRWDRIGICVALGATLVARAAAAQQGDPWDYRASSLTRVQLTQLLARYEAAGGSPAYSEALRARARADVDSIRARLADGDLRVGDRLRLRVEGQPSLSDSFAVTEGPALVLPVIGTVDLKGVLRSELQDRLAASVDSVYRAAVVRVIVLTRLAILGGVGKPGFYSLTRDALVADALTAAGGIAPGAQLTDIYVERGRSRLLGADSLQTMMRQGKTIGDLRLVDGDRIVVPVEVPRNALQTVQVLSYMLSLGLSLFTLSRVL
jgi:protein involved in polysaccharide export with SLBB domain